MDTLMQILDKQYEDSLRKAEAALSCIDYHCQMHEPPILDVITRHRENLDEAVRGMVAVTFARIGAMK